MLCCRAKCFRCSGLRGPVLWIVAAQLAFLLEECEIVNILPAVSMAMVGSLRTRKGCDPPSRFR